MSLPGFDPTLEPPPERIGPEFDAYRAAVLQLLRDDGYAATSAIALCRRCELDLREGWALERPVDETTARLIEFDEASDTDTEDAHDPPAIPSDAGLDRAAG